MGGGDIKPLADRNGPSFHLGMNTFEGNELLHLDTFDFFNGTCMKRLRYDWVQIPYLSNSKIIQWKPRFERLFVIKFLLHST